MISITAHEQRAVAAMIHVVKNACAAKPSAWRLEPALKPSHPNQRILAPRNT